MKPLSPLAPRWMREVHASLLVNPHIVLWGNVHDRVLAPIGEKESDGFRTEPLQAALARLLVDENGFDLVLGVDPIDGSSVLANPNNVEVPDALRIDAARFSLTQLQGLIGSASEARDLRVAVVVDYASRLVADPSSLQRQELQFFAACQKIAEGSDRVYVEDAERPSLHNMVFWLVDGERDLPTWYTMGCEAVRMIPVPLPDTTDRSRIAAAFASTLEGGDDGFVDLFVDHTESMTAIGMVRSMEIASEQQMPAPEIDDAVRAYRFGLPDNPWRRPSTLQRIADAERILGKKVAGQDHAVDRVVDTLMRSTTNLTGAHSKRTTGRPRGVLFFAGPTGVGKTALAKALAELVFGSEDSAIRFDMSEYSSEHAGERLVGSPPGYVGFDAGGQLTGAVQQQPFSLLLFDEIDKADPRILDKFLQVLDAGRLTDGAGQTVHFSETIIVFTSNKGIVNPDGSVNVDHAFREKNGFEAVEDIVQRSIKDYFFSIQRPELLNRLGENIIVFDFITSDVAGTILRQKLEAIEMRVAEEHGIELIVSRGALDTLEDLALSDLSNGGRGIVNHLEVAFLNPLAREIFRLMSEGPLPPQLEVTGIRASGGGYELVTR